MSQPWSMEGITYPISPYWRRHQKQHLSNQRTLQHWLEWGEGCFLWINFSFASHQGFNDSVFIGTVYRISAPVVPHFRLWPLELLVNTMKCRFDVLGWYNIRIFICRPLCCIKTLAYKNVLKRKPLTTQLFFANYPLPLYISPNLIEFQIGYYLPRAPIGHIETSYLIQLTINFIAKIASFPSYTLSTIFGAITAK